MSRINLTRASVSSALLLCLSMSTSATFAASHCKGMSESACATDTQCAWIDGYVRKDGREVSSHCRLKPGKKSVSAANEEPLALSQSE